MVGGRTGQDQVLQMTAKKESHGHLEHEANWGNGIQDTRHICGYLSASHQSERGNGTRHQVKSRGWNSNMVTRSTRVALIRLGVFQALKDVEMCLVFCRNNRLDAPPSSMHGSLGERQDDRQDGRDFCK